MSAMYIDDGYTRRRTIKAVPGLHPEVTIVYRPALARTRNEYVVMTGRGDVDRTTKFESELLTRHVVEVNGETLTADRADRLEPNLRVDALNLVLGYMVGDEEAGEKKDSPSASG